MSTPTPLPLPAAHSTVPSKVPEPPREGKCAPDCDEFADCPQCGDPACPRVDQPTAACMYVTAPKPKTVRIVHDAGQIRVCDCSGHSLASGGAIHIAFVFMSLRSGLELAAALSRASGYADVRVLPLSDVLHVSLLFEPSALLSVQLLLLRMRPFIVCRVRVHRRKSPALRSVDSCGCCLTPVVRIDLRNVDANANANADAGAFGFAVQSA